LSRKPQRSGLFHGFWYTLAGRKLERVRREDYGEAYRLYALGTRYGLTERAQSGMASRQERSLQRGGVAAARSVSSHPAAREANPFH